MKAKGGEERKEKMWEVNQKKEDHIRNPGNRTEVGQKLPSVLDAVTSTAVYR